MKLSEEAVRALEAYPWPGNVRELENTMQRAAVLAQSEVLLPKDIPLGQSAPIDRPVSESASAASATTQTFAHVPTAPLTIDTAINTLFDTAATDDAIQLLPWLEREFTFKAMQRTGNNQVQAARLLGITRATLRKRLERNGQLGVGDEEDE
jgi:DNA-binding NtrC family response regulator